MSAAYRSLHINTSREMMAYADFPMPAEYPDYPHHSQILAYFESYVDHFGFRDKIQFQTSVRQVLPLPDGSYEVHTDQGQQKRYAGVIVANGHHWSPRYPQPPFAGEFTGETLHAHSYHTPEAFAGKKVCVLGIGNSGVDIACELARLGGKTMISTRSGAHIMPKYVFGKPTDTLAKPPLTYAPIAIQRAILGLTMRISRGRQEDYGMPTPKRKLLHEHPTISADLLNLVGHGRISIKPNIQALEGNQILFEDGSREAVDVLIYATGYNISFPFFEESWINPRDNQMALYHHVLHPDHPGLYFIGLIQPLGAIMPLAELQSEWVARLITGEVARPTQSAMVAEIQAARRRLKKRYLDRPRHTLQVDIFPYRRLLQREMKRHRVSGKAHK
jgi:hypothetical protein